MNTIVRYSMKSDIALFTIDMLVNMYARTGMKGAVQTWRKKSALVYELLRSEVFVGTSFRLLFCSLYCHTIK